MGGSSVSTDKASAARLRAAENGRAVVRDRRRFKVTPTPTGSVRVVVPSDTPGTIFRTTVRSWSPDLRETVLKDGSMNVKIGGDVLVGDLKGARIFTLALEERATCPRSCDHWRTCYGNAMNKTRRWTMDRATLRRLVAEVKDACHTHEKVLIRLHVLGDFIDESYVQTWRRLVQMHPNLHVFGFTAHKPGPPVGDLIAAARRVLGRRWAIRHSGMTGPWGSFTIDFPTERTRLGDAVVCPEQRKTMNQDTRMHCGACAVCWQTSHPVVFVEH